MEHLYKKNNWISVNKYSKLWCFNSLCVNAAAPHPQLHSNFANLTTTVAVKNCSLEAIRVERMGLGASLKAYAQKIVTVWTV